MKSFLYSVQILMAVCFLFLCCGKNADQKVKKEKNEINVSKTYSFEKLDSLFLGELSSRKIIMINDANHGQAYFMLRVTSFLNHWLDNISAVSKSDSLPRKIILFLECNKDAEIAINKYIRTGDIYNFLKTNIEFDLEAHSNIFTIDYMIFINELRKISERINRINEHIRDRKIKLMISGAESDPPFYKKIHEIDRQQLRKDQNVWFAKRDKKCSENIEAFLKNYPDYKAIVFYGSAHLLRNKANKSFDKNELDPDIYDYYLSYYLDSIFGRENVSILWYASNPWTEIEKVDKVGIQKNMPDYIIYSKPIPGAPVPFTFAKTKTYLNALYEILIKYYNSENVREIQIAKMAAFKLNNSMLRATPENAKKINKQFQLLSRSKDKKSEAKKFITLANHFLAEYSVLDGLNETSASINYGDYPDSMIFNRELFLMLTNIPSTKIQWPRQNLDSGDFGKLLRSKSKIINRNMMDIQRFIALYQLFISNEEEKKIILNYLKETLKFNGNANDSWLNWLYKSVNK